MLNTSLRKILSSPWSSSSFCSSFFPSSPSSSVRLSAYPPNIQRGTLPQHLSCQSGSPSSASCSVLFLSCFLRSSLPRPSLVLGNRAPPVTSGHVCVSFFPLEIENSGSARIGTDAVPPLIARWRHRAPTPVSSCPFS